jgi:hypothetical protein
MIKLSRWRNPGGQRSMCFAATGRLQGRAAKLLLVRRKSRYSANLAAIWSSRPGELPPQPLTEPYVILSHHTALVTQKIKRQ